MSKHIPQPTKEETIEAAHQLLDGIVDVATGLYQHGYIPLDIARQLCLAANAAAWELAKINPDFAPTRPALDFFTTMDLPPS